MTDSNTVSSPEAAEEAVYSKDYWDLVFEQLGRRPLFKVAMAVLAIVYASAIYAPLIANGRPYVIEAIDLGGYRSATSSLSAVTTGLGKKIEQTDEDYLAELEDAGTLGAEGVPQTRAERIIQERDAAGQRLALMRLYLPDDSEEPLDQYEELLQAGLTAFDSGNAEDAEARIDEAKKLARTFRRELAAWDPANPEKEGVRLVGVKTYPLFDSISWLEVFFMKLWGLVLTWPIWNRVLNRWLLRGDREAIRRWRRRKVLLVLAISSFSGAFWTWTVDGGGQPFDVSPYKSAITDGSMLLVKEGMTADQEDCESEPIWAPIRYGFAETHTEAMFRPPTWLGSAEIDEEGRYVRGARAAASTSDETTGYDAVVTPIKVLVGEPERNDAWRRVAGTDELGRDFFTRMLWGGRVSLMVGILSATLLTLIGVVIGSIAGYFGGWVDILIMRVIEILQSLPAFFLILMAMAFTDPEVLHPIFAIVITIAVIRWTGVARLVRGEFMRLREQEFVLAARSLGFSDARTIFRHVLPNALSPVLVSAAFAVAAGILTESAVSFLGFGTRPPEASWGSLVNESKNPTFWWIQVFPGVLIFITVTCYNLVGDAVRDALDPKMKV